MKLLSAIFILLCLCTSASRAQPLTLSGYETQGALAIMVDNSDTIYNYNAKHRLTPASITKLLTTAVVLQKFGPRYRIRTKIGVLHTERMLVVHGVFDPTTDSRYFNRNQLSSEADTIANALKRIGMTDNVCLATDASLEPFAPYCAKRLWEDMGNYYGAVPTCLMADDNSTTVYFHSPKETEVLCDVDSIVPEPVGYADGALHSFVKTYKGKADLCNIFLAGNEWYATGLIPANKGSFAVRSTMPNATAHYMQKLRTLLEQRGISFGKDTLLWTRPDKRDSTIHTISSPTLADIVATTNQQSVNLFADALLMHSVSRWSHATWNGNVEALKSALKTDFDITPTLYDGSGLSPANAISPAEMTTLLVKMSRSDFATYFYRSLGVAGKTGTLRLLGRGSPIEGKVFAKSGTLSGVVCYAGYIDCQSGRRAAFCIMINHLSNTNAEARNQITQWLTTIYTNN